VEKVEARAVAEAHTVVQAQCAASAKFQDELRLEGLAVCETAHAEVAGEAELCEQMAENLRQQLKEAHKMQEDLAERMAESLEATTPPLSPCGEPLFLKEDVSKHAFQPGPATPQLRELDAYAELVERLQVEVQREREEREASASSLTALRGSYRLLLQRVANDVGRCPEV